MENICSHDVTCSLAIRDFGLTEVKIGW
jgi:hypothetical protein